MIKSAPLFLVVNTIYLLLGVVFSAQAGMSGQITFYGAIVEPACQINKAVNTGRLSVDCSQRSDSQRYAVEDIVSSTVEYLDQEKSMAVLNLVYR